MVSAENESIDFNSKVTERESNLPFDFLNNQNRLIFDGDGEIFFVSQESSDCFNALPSDDSDNIVKWKVSID